MTIFSSIKKGSQAHEMAKQIQTEGQKTQDEIDRLNKKVEILKRVCQCLWQIVSEQLDLDEKTLIKKMKKLEAMNSSETPPGQCISCKRPIHPTKKKCIFCGTDQPENNFFDSL